MNNRSFFLPIVLFLAFLALLAGLWAGLMRLGWILPDIQINLSMVHGVLMVSGFLGTVISMERVVALRKNWLYAVPLLSGIGWVVSLALPRTSFGPLLITLGSLGMVYLLGIMIRREPAIHVIVIGVGALSWFIGNVLWLSGLPIFQVVFWWAAFLVLTITGERLELSRVLRMTKVKLTFFMISAGLFLGGIIVGMFAMQIGFRMTGLGMLALALWLLRFDIARRNLSHRLPLTRYIALCLYIGYFWLGFSGLLSLWYGAVYAGVIYDAIFHSIFVGFTISMIFGHAPIIFPAVLNRALPYHPSFYVSLTLLHVSLLMRVVGDLGGWFVLRRWGGMFNEIAILLFLAILVITIRTHKPQATGVKN